MHTYYCSKIIRRISREIWRDIRVLLFESIRRMDICMEKYSYIIGEKYSKDEWVRRNIHIARNAYENILFEIFERKDIECTCSGIYEIIKDL